ncbi:MAG: LamG-like jellyroll fold domain-containing protein [Candidatus Hodarchaeota archaeon]
MKKAIPFLLVSVLAISSKVVQADFIFGTPINLGPNINTQYSEGLVCVAPNNLSLYFISNRPGGSGAHDLYIITRSSVEEQWSQPTNLGPTVNSYAEEFFSCISYDELELYFDSTRSGGRGRRDLWETTRTDLNAPWTRPVNLGSSINTASDEVSPNFSADGLTLLFASDRPGGRGNYDLYICTRTSRDASWSAPINLDSTINSPYLDVAPSLSLDGLVLFFHSIRPSGFGNYDLYYSRRQTPDAQWSEPVNLGKNVNSSYVELGPSLSSDGRMLYFCEHPDHPPRPGGFGSTDLWQVPIEPVIDLNGGEIVDSADICIMVDHWGEDYPLCDIGPMPWGDGTVDIEDLKVLAEYLFGDLRCVTHFKLDEAKGNIANDSAKNRDGTVHGDPEWRPMNGIIGGALQLDGFDDYIKTGFLLNAAEGELSAFVWVKGGTPGQVVVSQQGVANWLTSDIQGNLMTELRTPTRRGKPLQSQTVITDGNWHRIGLVWDGLLRMLYVDDIAVAQDTQDELQGSDSGLYIGCGKAMEPGTFFSGLIDDICIYNQVIRP